MNLEIYGVTDADYPAIGESVHCRGGTFTAHGVVIDVDADLDHILVRLDYPHDREVLFTLSEIARDVRPQAGAR